MESFFTPHSHKKKGKKQTFKQIFQTNISFTDIKHNIVGIPFNTKYFPTINILNSKLHIKDKYTRMKKISLTFMQRLNKKLHFLKKKLLYIQPRTKTPETIIGICIQLLNNSSPSIQHLSK